MTAHDGVSKLSLFATNLLTMPYNKVKSMPLEQTNKTGNNKGLSQMRQHKLGLA